MLFLFLSCEEKQIPKREQVEDSKKDSGKTETQLSFTLKDFYLQSKELDKRVDDIFNEMTDDERIAQMIVTSAGSLGKPESYVRKLIKERKVGGILLLGGSKETFKEIIKSFKLISDSSGTLPLIFSTDAEPGLINKKIYGIKNFLPASTIKTVKQSENTAEEISEIIKGIGFNQNYAPVCDFPFNKEIIGNRSFGENENTITKLAEAFIKATQESNIIATAKHFPGHGNAKGDSHKEPAIINGDILELNIFRNMIKSGVISVMVGHITITNNKKYSTNGFPSTLSRNIVTDLLRDEMGFKGIIVTDAMNMEAVTKFPSPSLNAVKAGCDMILMPDDERKLINSVKEEMKTNSQFREQVYESVKRVVRVKVVSGIIKLI